MSRKVLTLLLPVALWLMPPTWAQHSPASSKSKETSGTKSMPFTMREYSRMVNLDVVVEDKKGHHIHGLKASDFKVYEETPSQSHTKHLQKIAGLREIRTSGLKPPVEGPANSVPGVYSNLVAVQKDPVPPTVLLVDGINTQIRSQSQMHEQMLKMLRQLPPNIPVAIILMGARLRMLQGFTTNHKALQRALAHSESATGQQLGHLNAKNNPDTPGNQLYGLDLLPVPGEPVHDPSLLQMIAASQEFDQLVYSGNIAERFHRTYDAFLAIARSLEGYPGRKNVLWLSTSFPLTLHAFMRNSDAFVYDSDMGRMNYWKQMRDLDNILSNANIAVYPVDMGGVRNLHVYSAEARPANPFATKDTAEDSKRVFDAATRQMERRNVEQDTMHAIAKDTGGKVCAGQNHLANCIHKAVHDSNDFYEISYYPNSGDWNGEYRKILVKVKRHNARLSYRHGYFATPEGRPDPQAQANALRKECGDLLNATGIVFSAKPISPHAQKHLRFRLLIDPSDLTFTPTPDGRQMLNLEVAVCTYNERGWSQKLMAYPLNLRLNTKAYKTLVKGGHLMDSIYVPGPKPSAVRLLVKDVPSGKLGSIYIPTAQTN